jgi:hypothetical protein
MMERMVLDNHTILFDSDAASLAIDNVNVPVHSTPGGYFAYRDALYERFDSLESLASALLDRPLFLRNLPSVNPGTHTGGT